MRSAPGPLGAALATVTARLAFGRFQDAVNSSAFVSATNWFTQGGRMATSNGYSGQGPSEILKLFTTAPLYDRFIDEEPLAISATRGSTGVTLRGSMVQWEAQSDHGRSVGHLGVKVEYTAAMELDSAGTWRIARLQTRENYPRFSSAEVRNYEAPDYTRQTGVSSY